MKLDNKTSNAMTDEIALTDTELETVLGGCNSPSYSYGSPSYSYGSPSYGGGSPSDCGGSPSYSGYPSFAPQYSNPFDAGSSSTSTTTYTVTTTTYSVSPAPSSCGDD